MIGIDTNVLVRFLVQDDKAQGAAAVAAFRRLTASDPGYLTTVVLVETYWVLTRAYKKTLVDVLATLTELLSIEELRFQDDAHVRVAVERARSGADFADALVAAACWERGCATVLSFDRRAQEALGFRAPA